MDEIELLDRIQIAVLKMMQERPVYDIETHKMPDILLEILKKAEMSIADIELAVAISEEIIKNPKGVDVEDYASFFDITFDAKNKLKMINRKT